MTEVTVLGAGIFGLSVAWECLRRGASVRVVEKRHVGAGSSGGVVGALAPHTPDGWNPKKQFQFESLVAAGAFWAEVAAAGGVSPGYARTGRLQPVADARGLDLARARADAARDAWGDAARWEVIAAPADGWAPSSPSGYLIHDTLTARMNPAAACRALAAAIEARGGRIDRGSAAPGATGALVLATGYEGLSDLSTDLCQPVGAGVKGQALSLGLDAGEHPQLFVDGLHIVPHGDGTVAVGSTSERDWEAPDTTDDQLDALHARAVAACPALEAAPVIARWAGVRPRARTRAPMLGPHPLRDGVFIANGGFKIGFGIAPGVARIMADLVLEGRDRIPEEFRVEASVRP